MSAEGTCWAKKPAFSFEALPRPSSPRAHCCKRSSAGSIRRGDLPVQEGADRFLQLPPSGDPYDAVLEPRFRRFNTNLREVRVQTSWARRAAPPAGTGRELRERLATTPRQFNRGGGRNVRNAESRCAYFDTAVGGHGAQPARHPSARHRPVRTGPSPARSRLVVVRLRRGRASTGRRAPRARSAASTRGATTPGEHQNMRGLPREFFGRVVPDLPQLLVR